MAVRRWYGGKRLKQPSWRSALYSRLLVAPIRKCRVPPLPARLTVHTGARVGGWARLAGGVSSDRPALVLSRLPAGPRSPHKADEGNSWVYTDKRGGH